MTPPMSPKWLYCSLAAGEIARAEGYFDDTVRVKKLAYALYEAALRAEPTQCPTRWADGAVSDNRIKPKKAR